MDENLITKGVATAGIIRAHTRMETPSLVLNGVTHTTIATGWEMIGKYSPSTDDADITITPAQQYDLFRLMYWYRESGTGANRPRLQFNGDVGSTNYDWYSAQGDATGFTDQGSFPLVRSNLTSGTLFYGVVDVAKPYADSVAIITQNNGFGTSVESEMLVGEWSNTTDKITSIICSGNLDTETVVIAQGLAFADVDEGP